MIPLAKTVDNKPRATNFARLMVTLFQSLGKVVFPLSAKGYQRVKPCPIDLPAAYFHQHDHRYSLF